MCPKDDWRLREQESYLKGKVLYRRRWSARSAKWDHDHCEFCWQKFSAADGDGHDGYTTEDSYYWICPACFEDFRVAFGWTVAEEYSDSPSLKLNETKPEKTAGVCGKA